MHLAFLTPEYPHLLSTPSGGLGTSIKTLAEQLVRKNVEVTVFVYGQKEDHLFEEAGIHFHFIELKKYNFLGWYRYRKHLESYLNRTIRELKIDALEAPDWTGITALMSLKCPIVIRFHGSDSYFCRLENRPRKKKNFYFEKIALKSADHLLSVSEFTALKTQEIFDLKKKIKVIPNSVDVDMFSPKNEAPVPGTILYVGSIIRKKGVLELAHIFNCIHHEDPGVQLVMAGRDVADISTGNSTSALFEKILTESAKKQVVWKGNLPYPKVISELQKAAVAVLPSFAEALPMAWLEAMAMEKALVTSNIGWAKEVMTDGETGYTEDPRDHELYAAKVLEFLKDPELAEKMGKAARHRVVERFSTEVVVEENLRFYESVVRRR